MSTKGKGLEVIKIYCDGGARGNPGPASCAFVVEKNNKIVYKEAKYLGRTTNNVAEYNGVISALKWLNLKNNYQRVEFYLDSQLVVNQLRGIYKVKNENLKELKATIYDLEKCVGGEITYQYIPREKNSLPDNLLNKEIDENL
jgi:ribonuclease HI